MEFFQPLFLSRLEFLNVAFWALFFFWFSSMISLTLANPLYLFADDSTLCHTICNPSDQQSAASSLSADLDKITHWSNGVLSSPLPVQAGVPQCSILSPVLFMVFINHLSDSLEHPLYLFADYSTLCRTKCHPSDWQAAASSLSVDFGKITNWSNTWNMSFNPDKSHTLTMSLGKDCLDPPPPSPIYFLNNSLEVLSFRLLQLTICHDLCYESYISKLASKASRRLGILRHAKFLPWHT